MEHFEGETEGESMADIITPKYIINHASYYLKPLLFGILITPLIVIYVNKKMKKSKISVKIAIILLPIILGLIINFLQYSPKPSKAYVLSLLYDDDKIVSEQVHKHKDGWLFVGSAMIMIDGKQHIFVGGGDNQKDQLLIYENGKFTNIIDKTNLSDNSNTFSAVSIDTNYDEKEDLIVGRRNGVYLYRNMGSYRFDKIKIDDAKDRVPLAIAVSDYNKDARPDIYVSYFTPVAKYRGTIFNDAKHGRKNKLFKNTAIGFKDVSKETNAGGKPYNTFTSAFIDLDNDSWVDLVLSHDSGEIEILKNKQGKFESEFVDKRKGNWMGLATGDIDNDGDQDLFLTNLGVDTKKDEVSVGDLKKGQKQAFKHFLLRNDGNFKFTEISKEMGIDGKGFGWGAVMTDLDSDKNLDLLFAENTKLFPLHHVFPKPNHVYMNNSKKMKRSFEYNNNNFGQTPLIGDINGDNRKDIVWINMNGPVVAHLNKENQNNYIIVQLPNNAEYVNAKVVLQSDDVKMYREVIQGGIGFGSDSDNAVHFGLGDIDKIDLIKVYTLKNKIYEIKNPKINSILKLKDFKK